MDRFAKIKTIENLELLQKNLQKLLEDKKTDSVIFQKLLKDTKANLEKVSDHELPILICTNQTEDDIHFVYYLGDLDRVRTTQELLPNTIDFQSKLNCPYNMKSIIHTQKYLNSLISEVINKNNVHNWIEVSILLEKIIEEKNTNKKRR